MNRQILRSYMVKYGDTGESLAAALGIQRNTLSSKMNEYRGAEFTQGEIKTIKDRYHLTADDIDLIFFDIDVSKKDTYVEAES